MSLKVGQEVWYVAVEDLRKHAGVQSCRIIAADADNAAVLSPFGVTRFLPLEHLFAEQGMAERYAADVAREKGWSQ